MEWTNALTDFFVGIYDAAYGAVGDGLFIALLVVGLIAIVAQWRLYEKAGQPGYACLVPVWNVVVFLRILGRPWQHIFYFFIPFYNIYFTVKIYIELCNAFGKHSIVDYILVIVFNGFYILNLGLSYEERYFGPVYGQDGSTDQKASSPQIA